MPLCLVSSMIVGFFLVISLERPPYLLLAASFFGCGICEAFLHTTCAWVSLCFNFFCCSVALVSFSRHVAGTIFLHSVSSYWLLFHAATTLIVFRIFAPTLADYCINSFLLFHFCKILLSKIQVENLLCSGQIKFLERTILSALHSLYAKWFTFCTSNLFWATFDPTVLIDCLAVSRALLQLVTRFEVADHILFYNMNQCSFFVVYKHGLSLKAE